MKWKQKFHGTFEENLHMVRAGNGLCMTHKCRMKNRLISSKNKTNEILKSKIPRNHTFPTEFQKLTGEHQIL